MIAVDTNLLIYSHREDSEFHGAAKESVDQLRHQPAPWAIPWPCIHEFIGIASHPLIYKPASTLSQAFAFLDGLFASPQLQLSEPPFRSFISHPAKVTTVPSPMVAPSLVV